MLKRPVEGRTDILAVIKHAVALSTSFSITATRARSVTFRIYMESYRSRIQGVPIETCSWRT